MRIWTASLEIQHASGRTRVKDFGTPIWAATYQPRPDWTDGWRVRLDLLQNGPKKGRK